MPSREDAAFEMPAFERLKMTNEERGNFNDAKLEVRQLGPPQHRLLKFLKNINFEKQKR